MSDFAEVRPLLHAFTWLLAVGVLCGVANAETIPLSLEYSAPPSCPSEEQFWRALSSRSPNARRAENAKVVLRVALSVVPGGVRGRLRTVRDGVTSEPRLVEAPDCQEVVQALAFTAALSLDPALQEERVEREPVEYQEPPAVPLDVPRAVPRDESSWRFHPGALAAFGSLVDLQPNVGVRLVLAANRQADGEFEPSVQLGFLYSSSGPFAGTERAEFQLTAFDAQLCPLRAGTYRLSLRPCVAVQGGMLGAVGRNLSDPERTQRWFWALGPALRIESPLFESVSSQLEVSAMVPLRPQVYSVGVPESEIARTQSVSPWVALGANYSF